MPNQKYKRWKPTKQEAKVRAEYKRTCGALSRTQRGVEDQLAQLYSAMKLKELALVHYTRCAKAVQKFGS